MIRRSILLGTGSALPKRVVTNAELAETVDTSDVEAIHHDLLGFMVVTRNPTSEHDTVHHGSKLVVTVT